MALGKPSRIDVHHHVVPDFYRDWLQRLGFTAGGMPLPTWRIQSSRRVMRLCGARAALLSVSTPGVDVASGADAAAMARELNGYTHEIVSADRERLGFFATLPLPDVDRAIEELDRSHRELGADGVVLLANAQGTYLGDPRLDPLMAELDQRDAVVFVHPSTLPGGEAAGIPAYAADFLLDTTRAAINLCRNRVLDRYPRIRFILPHGGGMIPYAALRLAPSASPSGHPIDGLRRLRRFYFDTALTPSPFSMPSLLRFAAKDRLLFGSDYPFASGKVAVSFSHGLSLYPTTHHDAINHHNAERLFPRFAHREPVSVRE